MTATRSAIDKSPTLVAHDRHGDRLLMMAAVCFTVAVILHGLDHLRRGVDAVDLDVFWAGTLAMTVEIAVVALVAQRHRLAPLAAVSIGSALAVGYVVVHFLPSRSWLSDSLTSGTNISPLSWAAASVEIAAALALATAGLLALRHRGGLQSATSPYAGGQSTTAGLVHPSTLAMTVGNAVLLAGSVIQLA